MRRFVLTIEGADYRIEWGEGALTVNGRPFNVQMGDGTVTVDGIEYGVEISQDTAWVDGFAYPFVFRDGHGRPSTLEGETMPPVDSASGVPVVVHGGHSVVSAMPGKVLRVLVKEGDAVEAGDMVCILEAMKMENELHVEIGGTVQQILVKPGQSVEADQPLVIIA